ncbi:MAG: bisanhydrobacterioruberin hydratase [Haloarculaceae archaeon]
MASVARAERLVRDNRFAIAVLVPLVGALVLVAGTASLLPPALAYNPAFLLLGTFVMRLPLLVTVAPLVDRRAGLALVALAGFVYAIEFVGVTTGWPYGSFEYLVELGPMLFGTVPAGLPLFFLPLVLDAYLLSLLVLGTRAPRSLRLGAALGVVLVVDLVLDPGAVTVGFWVYHDPGAYYGVPLSNYLGWLLSGTVSLLALDYAFDGPALSDRLDRCEFALDDLASFVVFWGVVNVYGANWLPVAFTGALLVALLATTDALPRRLRWWAPDGR